MKVPLSCPGPKVLPQMLVWQSEKLMGRRCRFLHGYGQRYSSDRAGIVAQFEIQRCSIGGCRHGEVIFGEASRYIGRVGKIFCSRRRTARRIGYCRRWCRLGASAVVQWIAVICGARTRTPSGVQFPGVPSAATGRICNLPNAD